MKENIKKSVLHVKDILLPICEGWRQCLSLEENYVYYGLKSSIFSDVGDLWITGGPHNINFDAD
jgi:hypothetical protein